MDGSLYKQGKGAAAWAAIVVGQDGEGFFLHMVLRGHLEGSTSLPLTPASATSTTVECVALLWAMNWAAASNPGCKVEFVSDSLGALGSAAGNFLPQGGCRGCPTHPGGR